MKTRAEVIAEWAAVWEPKLLDRFDEELAAEDPQYSETWLLAEATPEADADLNQRLAEEAV